MTITRITKYTGNDEWSITVNVNKCNPGETPVEDRWLLNFKEREKERERDWERDIYTLKFYIQCFILKNNSILLTLESIICNIYNT